MTYKLRDDVSYCRVDDRLIFLDMKRDRYFRLPRAMERAFVAYLSGSEDSKHLQSLSEIEILTKDPSPMVQEAAIAMASPLLSAVEQRPPPKQVRIITVLEVLAIICTTQWQLKRYTLKEVLDSLIAYRQDRSPHPHSNLDVAVEHKIIEVADAFRRARPYVPAEPICLLDSLAMVRFLARLGLHANIAFGVAPDPFSAHCWVQAGRVVLNDTIGNTSAYSRIRVV